MISHLSSVEIFYGEDHQYNTENAGQENVATEVVEEAEEILENEHQQNTENAGQENVASEVDEEEEEIIENGSNEGSSDYETDDEQSFYEQFKDWDALTDEYQSDTKRFLDENYTVKELKSTFKKYHAAKKGRPTAGEFRKFILRSPGMPKKRKSLDDMTKTIEEKETETSELKIKLHDTRCFMVKQASVLHNFDRDLCKSNECIDKIKIQYEKVHDKNQELLQANTHMLQINKALQRNCNFLLAETKEKDQTISNQDNCIKSLTTKNNDQDDCIKSLTTKNNDQDDCIKSLTTKNNDQDDCIKSLTTKNNDQDDCIKSLKMESTKLQKKISKQGKVNFDLMKEKTLLEEEKKDMKVKYTDLKIMNVKQNIDLEDMNIKLKKQKLVCDELKSELCDTNSRLETVEKELITKNCEINRFELKQHEEMKQLQTQVAELKEMLNSRNAVAENQWPACTIL